jgi:hypothetical protein
LEKLREIIKTFSYENRFSARELNLAFLEHGTEVVTTTPRRSVVGVVVVIVAVVAAVAVVI